MGAIFEGGLLLAVILCAIAVAGANLVLYRWSVGRSPMVRRAAQFVLPVLLLGVTIIATSLSAPAPPRETGAISNRLAWTAQSAKRLVESTRPLQADPVVTGTLRAKEQSGASERSPPADRRDVVQVFYGTDRARADKPNRIAYGTDRAQRLELGRAFVTIPTAHQARSISRPWSIKRPYFAVALRDEGEDPRTHFTVSQIGTLTRVEMHELVADRLQSVEGLQKSRPRLHPRLQQRLRSRALSHRADRLRSRVRRRPVHV